MTVGNIIERLVDEGYQIDLGPHVDLPGYYCAIYRPGEYEVCPECENEGPMAWEDSGHGHTLLDAVLNARDLKEGRGVVMGISKFKGKRC